MNQSLIENKESIICEFCGIEISRPYIKSYKFRERKSINRLESKETIEKKKKNVVENISRLIHPRKYSIGLIIGDDDFPKNFKENLIIVISRLIFVNIRESEQINKISVCKVSIEKSILYYIIKRINPLFDKRIKNIFLKILYKKTKKRIKTINISFTY